MFQSHCLGIASCWMTLPFHFLLGSVSELPNCCWLGFLPAPVFRTATSPHLFSWVGWHPTIPEFLPGCCKLLNHSTLSLPPEFSILSCPSATAWVSHLPLHVELPLHPFSSFGLGGTQLFKSSCLSIASNRITLTFTLLQPGKVSLWPPGNNLHSAPCLSVTPRKASEVTGFSPKRNSSFAPLQFGVVVESG